VQRNEGGGCHSRARGQQNQMKVTFRLIMRSGNKDWLTFSLYQIEFGQFSSGLFTFPSTITLPIHLMLRRRISPQLCKEYDTSFHLFSFFPDPSIQHGTYLTQPKLSSNACLSSLYNLQLKPTLHPSSCNKRTRPRRHCNTARRSAYIENSHDHSQSRAPPIGFPVNPANATQRNIVPLRTPISLIGDIWATMDGSHGDKKAPDEKP